jgi:hypothetical protein
MPVCMNAVAPQRRSKRRSKRSNLRTEHPAR